MRKTISIAMTTYNGEKYLREQLDSLYNQTLLADEIVVCDDNSSDKTIEILEEYRVKKGLRYYVNNPSLGVSENFYKAISLCTSDYTALCDQDDIWLPNKIEMTYNKLRCIDDGNASLVSSQCININAEGKIMPTSRHKKDLVGYKETLIGNGFGQGCSLMFNSELKDVILKNKDYSPVIKNMIYDGFINMTASIIGNKCGLCSQLMLYRHHSNNVMARNEHISFRKKINKMWYLWRFIPDERLLVLKELHILFRDQITDPDIDEFLSRINRLSIPGSYISNMRVILSLDELSTYKKILVVMGSLFSYILKWCFTSSKKDS